MQTLEPIRSKRYGSRASQSQSGVYAFGPFCNKESVYLHKRKIVMLWGRRARQVQNLISRAQVKVTSFEACLELDDERNDDEIPLGTNTAGILKVMGTYFFGFRLSSQPRHFKARF